MVTLHRPPCSTATRGGFSLIELLVVISIVSAMIALLLPALRKARVSAQTLQSTTQARQMVIALVTYAGDHTSSLPFARFWDPGQAASSPQGLYWSNKILIGGYVSTPEAFWSPARAKLASNLQSMRVNPETTLLAYTGYGANGLGAMPSEKLPLDASSKRPIRLGGGNRTPPPSKHLLLVEVFRDQPNTWQISRDGWWISTPTPFSALGFTYDGLLVRAYMDGHAGARDGADIGWVHEAPRKGTWVGDGMGEPWYDMTGDDFH